MSVPCNEVNQLAEERHVPGPLTLTQMRVLLLNGPNLNLLGTRRPEVYGSTTLAELEQLATVWATQLGIDDLDTFQSNHEGRLIDRIHAARGETDGIVFNPGAFTHTSYALHDAIEAVGIPTVEIHISNVEEREGWRRQSVIRPACVHTIYGRGIDGYRWALRHLHARAARAVQRLSYGTSPEQFADLRLPGGSPASDLVDPARMRIGSTMQTGDGPYPLVVTVHGGFWRHQWTRDTIEMSALDLVDRGVASLNVEYRRVGAAGGGGGGSASVEDVADAVIAALEHPAIDAGRWAIAGHSAGGQLALAAVPRIRAAGAAPPAVAVSLGGVVDLSAAIEQHIGEGAASAYVGAEAPSTLSPADLVPLGVPLLVAHGRDDASVPLAQSESLAKRARDAGDEVEIVLSAGGHFEFLDPSERAWSDVADRVVKALHR